MPSVCEWCAEPLVEEFDVPALCKICYEYVAEADKHRYAQGWITQYPVVERKRDNTMPDCPCGGETYEAGDGVYRCRECGQQLKTRRTA